MGSASGLPRPVERLRLPGDTVHDPAGQGYEEPGPWPECRDLDRVVLLAGRQPPSERPVFGPVRDADLSPAGEAVEERGDLFQLEDVPRAGLGDWAKEQPQFALTEPDPVHQQRNPLGQP